MTEEDKYIEEIRMGSKSAFTLLVKEHREKVINTCYRFLLNAEDAEDISQEVFIEVYNSIKSFRGDSKLSTWIYRIAVTKCLDEIKKRQRKKRISSIGKVFHIDEVIEWLTNKKTPATDLQEKEKLHELLDSLDKLPENQRVALTLSKIEYYTNSEIAEVMNSTTGAVESLISRGKKKLKEELQKKSQNKK